MATQQVIKPALPDKTISQVETYWAKTVAFLDGNVYVHLWVFPVVLVAGFVIAKLL